MNYSDAYRRNKQRYGTTPAAGESPDAFRSRVARSDMAQSSESRRSKNTTAENEEKARQKAEQDRQRAIKTSSKASNERADAYLTDVYEPKRIEIETRKADIEHEWTKDAKPRFLGFVQPDQAKIEQHKQAWNQAHAEETALNTEAGPILKQRNVDRARAQALEDLEAAKDRATAEENEAAGNEELNRRINESLKDRQGPEARAYKEEMERQGLKFRPPERSKLVTMKPQAFQTLQEFKASQQQPTQPTQPGPTPEMAEQWASGQGMALGERKAPTGSIDTIDPTIAKSMANARYEADKLVEAQNFVDSFNNEVRDKNLVQTLLEVDQDLARQLVEKYSVQSDQLAIRDNQRAAGMAPGGGQYISTPISGKPNTIAEFDSGNEQKRQMAMARTIHLASKEDRALAADRILTAHIEKLTPGWTPEARQTLREDLDKMNSLRRSEDAAVAVTSGGKVRINSRFTLDVKRVAAGIDKLVAESELSPEEAAEAKAIHARQVEASESAIKQAALESEHFKRWIAKNPEAAKADQDAQFEAYSAAQTSWWPTIVSTIKGFLSGSTQVARESKDFYTQFLGKVNSEGDNIQVAASAFAWMDKYMDEQSKHAGERVQAGFAAQGAGFGEALGQFVPQMTVPLIVGATVTALAKNPTAGAASARATAMVQIPMFAGVYALQGYSETARKLMEEDGRFDSLTELIEKDPQLGRRIHNSAMNSMEKAIMVSGTEYLPFEKVLKPASELFKAKGLKTFAAWFDLAFLNPAVEVLQEEVSERSMSALKQGAANDFSPIEGMQYDQMGQIFLAALVSQTPGTIYRRNQRTAAVRKRAAAMTTAESETSHMTQDQMNARVAEYANDQRRQSEGGTVVEMPGWDATNPQETQPEDYKARKLVELEYMEQTLQEAEKTATDATRTQIRNELAKVQQALKEVRITPEAVAIASELSTDAAGKYARNEAEIAQAKSDLAALDHQNPKTSTLDDIEAAQKRLALGLENRRKLFDGGVTTEEAAQFRKSMALAQEVAQLSDKREDPNENGIPNGASRRSIAKAIAKVVRGIPLTTAELELNSAHGGKVFKQDKKTGRVTVVNSKTIESLSGNAPILANEYTAYETKLRRIQEAESAAEKAQKQQKESPKEPASDQTDGGKPSQPEVAGDGQQPAANPVAPPPQQWKVEYYDPLTNIASPILSDGTELHVDANTEDEAIRAAKKRVMEDVDGTRSPGNLSFRAAEITPKQQPSQPLQPGAQVAHKTPREWAEAAGIEIMDPDGWREENAPDFEQPTSWEDFRKRAMRSTINPGSGGFDVLNSEKPPTPAEQPSGDKVKHGEYPKPGYTAVVQNPLDPSVVEEKRKALLADIDQARAYGSDEQVAEAEKALADYEILLAEAAAASPSKPSTISKEDKERLDTLVEERRKIKADIAGKASAKFNKAINSARKRKDTARVKELTSMKEAYIKERTDALIGIDAADAADAAKSEAAEKFDNEIEEAKKLKDTARVKELENIKAAYIKERTDALTGINGKIQSLAKPLIDAAQAALGPLIDKVKRAFTGGVAYIYDPDSLGGYMSYNPETRKLEVNTASLNPNKTTINARTLIEEWMHAIGVELGIDFRGIWKSLPQEIKDFTFRSYAHVQTEHDYNKGAEALRMILQKHIGFTEDGRMWWDENGKQSTTEEVTDPTLRAKILAAFKEIAKYLKNLVAELRTANIDPKALEEIEYFVEGLKAAIKQLSPPQSSEGNKPSASSSESSNAAPAAPPVAGNQPPVAQVAPPNGVVTLHSPQGNIAIKAKIVVLDLSEVEGSEGTTAQPRDRDTRDVYKAQHVGLAKIWGPQQASVIGYTDRGAILLSEEGRIISGHGRAEALKIIFSEPAYAQTAKEQREFVVNFFLRNGMPEQAEQARKAKVPSIGTRVVDLGGYKQFKDPLFHLARDSNPTNMSAAETAMADAKDERIAPIISRLIIDDNGNISYTESDRKELVDLAIQFNPNDVLGGGGELLNAFTTRINRAALASFLGPNNRKLVTSLIENEDTDGLKNFTKALILQAPLLSKAKESTDLVDKYILPAIENFVKWKKEGGTGTFAEWAGQGKLPLVKGDEKAIDPNIIRIASTIGNAKGTQALADALTEIRLDAEMGTLFSQKATPAASPAFYSKLAQVIEAKMPARASSDQIKGIINPEKGSGVKAEEIKWSGIIPWLDARKGATKQEMLEYLRNEGAVRFEEVVLGGKLGQRYNEQLRKRVDDLARELRILREDTSNVYGEDKRKWPKEVVEPIEKLKADLRQAISERDNDAETKEALFEKYQLTGGENYREVVLAMPERKDTRPLPDGITLTEDNVNGWVLNFPDGRAERLFVDTEREAKIAALAKFGDRNTPNYISSHFPDISGYVAHGRWQNRVLPDGTKSLHSLENQNDASNAYLAARQEWIDKNVRKDAKFDDLTPEQQEEAKAYARSKVPDTPFQGNPAAWIMAIFKRQLRTAVEGDYGAVSWDTGDTVADRFDLSKQVDSVEAALLPGGIYKVTARSLDGRVIDGLGELKENQLAAAVGKDLAEKIIEQGSGVFSGIDLKVGGEDKRKLYDQISVREIAKYVKQWGAKVEKSTIGTTTLHAVHNENGEPIGSFKNREQAEAFASAAPGRTLAPLEATPIWRVNITSAMRESIQHTGQTLFSQAAITKAREESHRAPFPDVERPNFKLRSQSAKQATHEPWTLDESDFLKWSDFNDRIVDFYNKARVDSGDTSRYLPMAPLDLQVGQWMLDPFKGIHGREIAQLRLVDTNDLQPTEDNVPLNIEGRGDDSARYRQWLDQGLTPPPINVVETDKGSLRITDGHRRYYAHKAAGRPILAWVWPAMDHPDGAKADGGSGPVLRVGMTLEAIKASQPIAPATSTSLRDITGPTQFSNAVVVPPTFDSDMQAQREFFTRQAKAAGFDSPDDAPSELIRQWSREWRAQHSRFDAAGSRLFSQPARTYESMEFSPPFESPFGNILSYHWVSTGDGYSGRAVSDWSQARTNPQTGRKIVHHFKVERPNGSRTTVSLETAMGALSKDRRGQLNALIRSEMDRRNDERAGQMRLFSQRAFHGTPHDWAPETLYRLPNGSTRWIVDGQEAVPEGAVAIENAPAGRARADKVGTGKSVAAFGWGVLYGAGARQVADRYRMELSGNSITLDGTPFAPRNGEIAQIATGWQNPQDARTALVDYVARMTDNGNRKESPHAHTQDAWKIVQAIDNGTFKINRDDGNIYTVELDVETDELLDWDKPLGEQSQLVKDAFQAASKRSMNKTYKKALKKIWSFASGDDRTVREAYRQFANDIGGSEQDASEFLNKIGIPGIRFLDQGSRGIGATGGALSIQEDAAGKGWVIVRQGQYYHSGPYATQEEASRELAKEQGWQTFNYVIFDEKLIRVVEKNGEPIRAQAAQSLPNLTPEARESIVRRATQSLNATSPNLPVDAQAIEQYLESVGAPASPERTETSERISQAISQPTTRGVAEEGGFYQSDLFGGQEGTQAGPGKARAKAGKKASASVRKAGTTPVASPDLVAGLSGDWDALARAIDEKGRASSIFADLIERKIPSWDVVGSRIETPADVMALTAPIRSPYFESLKVAVIDGQNRVVASKILHVGSLNESIADPKAIFGELALLREKTGKKYNRLVISHNHPSGDPSPSTHDTNLTRRLQDVARSLGWDIVDHVITDGERYFSFREAGQIYGGTAPTDRTGSRKTPPTAPQPAPSQAEWEAVKRSALQTIDRPELVANLAKSLRNGNPDAVHVLYVNTKFQLLAIERTDNETFHDSTKFTQLLMAGAAREGAYAFILDLSGGASSQKDRSAIIKTRSFADVAGIHLLDAVVLDKTDPSRWPFSYKDAGLLEAPGQYGASSLRSQKPLTEQQVAGLSRRYNELFRRQRSGEQLTPEQQRVMDDAERRLGQMLLFDLDPVRRINSQRTQTDAAARAAGQILMNFAPQQDAGAAPMTTAPMTREQEQLVMRNMGLAGHAARRSAMVYGWDRDDAMQEASIALTRAAQGFDPAMGVPFSSYAYRVIANHLTNKGRQKNAAARANKQVTSISLNTPVARDGDPTGETTQDTIRGDVNPNETPERDEARAMLAESMQSIKPQAREILTRSAQGQTADEIAQALGITRQAVRQQMARSVERLRGFFRERGIRSTDDILPPAQERETPDVTPRTRPEDEQDQTMLDAREDDETRDTTTDDEIGDLNSQRIVTPAQARAEMGRSQPLDEQIRLPDGIILPISTLTEGDEITGATSPTRITGVFPQAKKQITVQIETRGNRRTRTSLDHLWYVRDRRTGQTSTVTTAALDSERHQVPVLPD